MYFCSMKKKKFYVVWKGRTTGIFDNWEECKKQTERFQNAKYKGYNSIEEATEAFKTQNAPPSLKNTGIISKKQPKPTEHSICVDAACSVTKQRMEYRGILYPTGKILFHKGPYEGASNNIGEFLAIVHALSYMQQAGYNFPVYSDSVTAMTWVRRKTVNSKIEMSETIRQIINKAIIWLSENDIGKYELKKWETFDWGEIPADFGRK